MIAVDSSVWIDHFSGRRSAQVDTLERLLATRGLPILVGDIVMYEVLRGFGTVRHASQIRRWFEPLLLVSMLDFELVPRAVSNCQALRRRGITPGTVDMIIGTYCIETGAELLTSDRDFVPMRDHLGLRLVGE
ncbi:MAG: type II toxin-antitoxin system VapC family toxin [Geminicoccaceae bacterium]